MTCRTRRIRLLRIESIGHIVSLSTVAGAFGTDARGLAIMLLLLFILLMMPEIKGKSLESLGEDMSHNWGQCYREGLSRIEN